MGFAINQSRYDKFRNVIVALKKIHHRQLQMPILIFTRKSREQTLKEIHIPENVFGYQIE